MDDDSNIEQIDEEFRILAEKRKKLAELTRGLSNHKDYSIEPDSETPSIRGTIPELSDAEKKDELELDESLTQVGGDAPEEPKTKFSDGKKPTDGEKPSKYDDGLALSKDEILEFCDRIIEKWGDDPTKDARHIFAMNAVKTSVIWTEEGTLKEIWKEIFAWAFEILYKNAIAQAKGENMKWSQVLDQIKKS